MSKVISTKIAGVDVALVMEANRQLVKVDFLTFDLDMASYCEWPQHLALHISHCSWSLNDQKKAVEFLIKAYKLSK